MVFGTIGAAAFASNHSQVLTKGKNCCTTNASTNNNLGSSFMIIKRVINFYTIDYIY